MQLIRGLSNVLPMHHGCVATIGNFDGMHCGHQAMLTELTKQATAQQLPAMLIMFEPQPREFFNSSSAPARLMRLPEKIRFLQTVAIDYVLVLRFNNAMAQQTADTFVRSVLFDNLGVRLLILGEDFCFGYQRQGDLQLLRTMGASHGMDVMVMPTLCRNDKRVSSTWVRDALVSGDLATVRTLLGRDYSLFGRVVLGQQRGRTINVPTANIRLKRLTPPIAGVYVVRVHSDYGIHNGVANVGVRPTVGGTQPGLEVHLFDFDRDLYGKSIQVTFLAKLRDEQRFASFDLLKAQIQHDIAAARALLPPSGRHPAA